VVFAGSSYFPLSEILRKLTHVRKEVISTAKGRRMAFIFIFTFIYSFFLFLMACGQGGTIVYEVLLFVCFLFSFLTLGARLVKMNFLQSIVSIATVTFIFTCTI